MRGAGRRAGAVRITWILAVVPAVSASVVRRLHGANAYPGLSLCSCCQGIGASSVKLLITIDAAQRVVLVAAAVPHKVFGLRAFLF